MPVAFSAFAASARPDEQPKLRPATRISPGFTFDGKSGLAVSRTCFAISFGVFHIIWVGVIRSVGILSPNFQQFPSKTSLSVMFGCHKVGESACAAGTAAARV